MDAKNRTVGSKIEREVLWRHWRDNTKDFIEAVWKIRPVRGRPQVMTLWPEQRDLIDWYEEDHEKYVSLKARQLGWTTTTTAWSFTTMFFHEYTPWLYVSQTQGDAIKNLNFVKFGYDNLPEWVRERGPEVLKRNEELVEFANGSRVESVPATGGAGRGDAVYGTMWDEAAFAPVPDEQFAAIDPLTYGKLIMLSTANGMGNLFQRTYADTKEPDSEWQGKFYPWHVRPDRQLEDGSPDWQGWYAREKRAKRATPWLMAQEYPSDDVEAFVKSGRTPISHDLLQEFVWEQPYHKMFWDGGQWRVCETEDDERMPLTLDVWEFPTVERDEDGTVLRNPNYVIFCDPAEGMEHGDATAIVVYDANTQTCVARSESWYALELLSKPLAALAELYSMALLGVERNNHGFAVLDRLNVDERYPRLYTMPKMSSRKGGHSHMLGWHTNVATKPKMVRDYAGGLQEKKLQPRDPRLRNQLATFVQDDQGRYGASSGNHDDVAMAHFGAYQLILDAGRFPILVRPSDDGKLRMRDFDKIAFGGDDRPQRRIGRRTTRATKSFAVPE